MEKLSKEHVSVLKHNYSQNRHSSSNFSNKDSYTDPTATYADSLSTGVQTGFIYVTNNNGICSCPRKNGQVHSLGIQVTKPDLYFEDIKNSDE